MAKAKKKLPADVNKRAKSIVDSLTADKTETPPQTEEEQRRTAAATLGRAGGKKGGPARAKKLSENRRIEIAKKAAAARWGTKTD